MDWLTDVSQINWLGVLLVFIASLAVGFVWYLPPVLGTRWMAAIGKTEEDLKNINGGAGLWLPMLLASALTAVLLAGLMAALGLDSALGGAVFGLAVGLVFRAGGHVIHNGFAGRSAAVTLIDAGHDLVAMGLAGAIIGAMS